MMKPIMMILLLLGCMFSALAETKVSSEFTHLQSIRAKKITEIDTAYVKALEKLKLKVMKRGDLVTANAIDAELENVRMNVADEKEIDATHSGKANVDADIYCNDSYIDFKDGISIFDNFDDWVFDEIPEKYSGYEITTNERRPVKPLEYKVKSAGIVTIVVEQNAYGAFIEEGWEPMDNIKRKSSDTSLKICILQKQQEKGRYSLKGKDVGVRLLRKK